MKFELEKTPHRQVYNLLIGLVAPRPIAWITSMDEAGVLNAAPFSAYNYLCTDPPIVGIGVTNRPGHDAPPKDTARNIRRTGEFVINVVTEDLIQQMNITATDFPAGVNELDMANLTTAPSAIVKVPRIAQAHAALECVEHSTTEIGRSRIILGRVVAMYVEDRFVEPEHNGSVPRISYEEWQKNNR
jgi:flavin reductase (DIM6/NTAB) family NADH-FMN oxidoreductase RutF